MLMLHQNSALNRQIKGCKLFSVFFISYIYTRNPIKSAGHYTMVSTLQTPTNHRLPVPFILHLKPSFSASKLYKLVLKHDLHQKITVN